MQGADWPQLARRLVGLQQAGVDLAIFLPRMGRMTAGVHQAVVANAVRTKAEGTDRWADLLEARMPEGLVRDAILAPPAWPDIAAAMGWLDARGIEVARILMDAHRSGVGVDQAVGAVTAAAAKTPTPAPARAATAVAAPTPATAATAAPAPAPAPGAAVGAARDVLAERMGAAADPWAAPASTDAKRSWGPLTEGLAVPRDLDLGDRAKALEQLGVNRLAHATIVGVVKDALPETGVRGRASSCGGRARGPGRVHAGAAQDVEEVSRSRPVTGRRASVCLRTLSSILG
ncbi:hypothetical protein [Streptomyces virginiae]|uniref:hypothetical protein n=1 Tax=Streptomyces virginiae TaxID=1961 RepID=UPI002F90D90E